MNIWLQFIYGNKLLQSVYMCLPGLDLKDTWFWSSRMRADHLERVCVPRVEVCDEACLEDHTNTTDIYLVSIYAVQTAGIASFIFKFNELCRACHHLMIQLMKQFLRCITFKIG